MTEQEKLDEILESYANFKLWESKQEWKEGYDRAANIANSRNRSKSAIAAMIAEARKTAKIDFLKEEIADIEEIRIIARNDKRKNVSWLLAWLQDDERELAELTKSITTNERG